MHSIVNFRQVDIPKPLIDATTAQNYSSGDDSQEMKSEDIEADIFDQFADNPDSLNKTCNETSDKSFEIEIYKRKSTQTDQWQ